jgi:hypothetical protein
MDGVARYCDQISGRWKQWVGQSVSDLIAKLSPILISQVSTRYVAVDSSSFQMFDCDGCVLILALHLLGSRVRVLTVTYSMYK